MIKPIMKDPIFLAQKSAEAGPADAPIAADLLDTLRAHADGCRAHLAEAGVELELGYAAGSFDGNAFL